MTRSPAPAPDRLDAPGRWASGQALRYELAEALATALVVEGVCGRATAGMAADELARVALQVVARELHGIARQPGIDR